MTSMTVTIGWWIVPTIVTVWAFGWHVWVHRRERPGYAYGNVGQALGRAITMMIAAVVSLGAWMMWALI